MTRHVTSAWERFPAETLHALFEAVEINDVVDPDVRLPDSIVLDCTRTVMQRCFALCRQFWHDGVHRAELLLLVNALLCNGDLSPTERTQYKHIRAKYKHLRFALTLYDKRHRPPTFFSITIAIMGHLQDAFRNRDRKAVMGYALLLRILLARPFWAVVRRRISAIRYDSAEGFLAYRRAEIRRLKTMLERQTLTGPEFHAMRKIISRQVSFYDTLRSLGHDEHDYRMSRFLSAMNGLMGSRHDDMVEQAISGERKYRAAAGLDADIRLRLEQFVARYPL